MYTEGVHEELGAARPPHIADGIAGALGDLLAALRSPGETTVLADREDGTVVRLGDVVAKAHPADSDPEALAVRLAVAADPALTGILLTPLDAARTDPDAPGRPVTPVTPGGVRAPGPSGAVALRTPDGRPATIWPYGTPVDPDRPDAAPWEQAGTLLARLHAVPAADLARRLPGPLPPMRGPVKAARALARMRAGVTGGPHAAARRAVEAAWRTLPAWCRAVDGGRGAPGGVLCHGDFHLGQLVRHPAAGGPWHLIDIDDLGLGDPAWDLARPASWYAAGLLPSAGWDRLLAAYQAVAGGRGGDPWPRLDAPARALTAQSTALALTRASAAGRRLEEDEEALVDACIRIGRLPSTARS